MPNSDNQKTPTMRLDKWLKITRLFKQRTKAERAIEAGHVKVNGERVKPAKQIRAGDELTVKKGHEYKEYTIKGLSTKSISAALARELYEEKQPDGVLAEKAEEMREVNELLKENIRHNRKAWRTSKENKKKRRQLRKWKYGE